MKIVNICMGAPFAEGYSYQDPMLSDYQHRLGHDVMVITGLKTRNKDGKSCLTVPGDTMLSNGVRLIRIGPKGLGKLAHNVLGIYPQIPELLDELKPDFIMVHGLGSHAAYYAAKYHQDNVNTHIIADNHQDSGITNTHSIILNTVARYFKYRWKSWVKEFDKVYGVTSWRADFAHEQYGIPYDKLDVLVLGIDDRYINLCDNLENRKAVRKKYGIPQNAFLFCSGGKLDKNKSVIEIMEAFHSCADDNLRYLIFGSVGNDIKGEFENLLAMDGRIIYAGFVPSDYTNNLLAASDFGLFAGLHSVLWEQAVGCGLPCLFRKYSDNDHVNTGGNCVQIESPDVETVERTIKTVSGDSEIYFNMKNAAKCGARKFAYTEIAKKSIECAEK